MFSRDPPQPATPPSPKGRIARAAPAAIGTAVIADLRSRGVAEMVADRAMPSVRHIPEMMWAPPVTHAHNRRVDIAATARTCGP